MKKRTVYFCIAAGLLIVEVLIALYMHDAFIRPYGGDILVVILIDALLRGFFPEKPRLLPLYVFLFAVCVEFLQRIHIVDLLGLGHIVFFRVLIGTGFSYNDILCYAAGCVIAAGIEFILRIRN